MKAFTFLLIVVLIVSCKQQDDQLVPQGKEPLLNNILGPGEWEGSKIFEVNDSLRLRMQQDDKFLYLAVDFDEVDLDQYRWVELYIYDQNKMYRFHASGQLGEQFFKPPYWVENWDWGNNVQWTATTQRLAGKERKSSTNQAYEFRIEKAKFKSHTMRLLFHGFTISTQADFDATPFRYYLPSNADRFKAETWMEFHL